MQQIAHAAALAARGAAAFQTIRWGNSWESTEALISGMRTPVVMVRCLYNTCLHSNTVHFNRHKKSHCLFIVLSCFNTNYKQLKATSFSLNWKGTEWLQKAEPTKRRLKRWQTLIWDHFLTKTADGRIHIITKHVGMLINRWLSSHYITLPLLWDHATCRTMLSYR